MEHKKEQRVRKIYRRPQLAAVRIELGVFGDYGGSKNRGDEGQGVLPEWLTKS